MIKQFREFALRGNVIDMAVGIIVGGAFTALVNQLVAQVLMPPLGLLTGGVDFGNLYLLLKEGVVMGPYASLAEAKAAGAVTLNYGIFLNSVVSFLLMAVAVFFLVRGINAIRRREEKAPLAPSAPATKPCPYCLTSVPAAASRCPACTSQLAG